MEGQDYLNQISASVRPEKKSGFDKIKSSKLFWPGVGCLVLLIAIIIVGAILGGVKGSGKETAISLKLHLDNTSQVMEEYRSNLKSSSLRSSTASLLSILSSTNRSVTSYVTEKYGYSDEGKEKDKYKDLVEEATLNKDGLDATLFNAKTNGILDRIYAHQITYEISSIMNEENKLYGMTSDESLKSALSTSYSSLENLYNDFSNFSETK